jgi:hypothetical protein
MTIHSNQVQLTGSNVLLQGVVTVTTPGTEVQLAANQACKMVTVVALPTNTGYIYVGNSAVSSSSFGAKLAAGGYVTIPVSNLNLVYVDADRSGDGASYMGVN